MKKIKFLVMFLLSAALVMPVLVSAAEFTGTIVGHKCAHIQTLCPLENREEHLANEPDFVLVKEDGSYHTLHNLPRDTKVRHIGQTVMINGVYDENTKGIYVNEFSNEEGKKIWSWEQQTKEGRPYFGLGVK